MRSTVLGLFDAFTDSDCKFWVDNLHAPVNFVVQSLNHKLHAIVEGVCRKGGLDFPDVCKQENVKGDDNIREAI